MISLFIYFCSDIGTSFGQTARKATKKEEEGKANWLTLLLWLVMFSCTSLTLMLLPWYLPYAYLMILPLFTHDIYPDVYLMWYFPYWLMIFLHDVTPILSTWCIHLFRLVTWWYFYMMILLPYWDRIEMYT